MLTLDGVTKVYKVGTFGGKELTAVRDVSFERRSPGEVVSLIGESGSGKTTIGRMILRLTPVTGGAITFDGVDVSTLKRRPRQGLLPPRAGRLPGPVQLVQPDLQGGPRLQHDPRAAYFPGLSSAEWEREARGVARGREPRPRRRPGQVPAPAQRRAAAAPADRPGAAARHQVPRRRRDHQHARRLDADRRAEPARRPQGARPRRSSSSRTTCRSATTSATGR